MSQESVPPVYVVVRVQQKDKGFPKPICQFRGIDAWGLEKFENQGDQVLDPFTQTYVL